MGKIDTILDYIDWRGDIPLSIGGFNDVDALIFTQLSYLDFAGIVPENFAERITLAAAWEKFRSARDFAERKNVGLVINPLSVDLLEAAAKSTRFSDVALSGFVDKFDGSAEEQFCALVFSVDEGHFVAFRGTDDTIVGWKEDFNLAFKDKVAAQVDAAGYLSSFLDEENARDEIFVGGHSKGGNLAIFSVSELSAEKFSRIKRIYNFDGPGFSKEKISSSGFEKLRPLVKSFFPHLSIVGQLFEHFDEFSVVESSGQFLMQHDPFTWAVRGPSFVFKESLDEKSEYFSRTFNGWLEKIQDGKREQFVDAVFSVIGATKNGSLSALHADSLRSSAAMLVAFKALDDETRKAVTQIAGEFIKEAGKNLSQGKGLKSV